MKLRQEQTVFAITLVVVGISSWTLSNTSARRIPRARTSGETEFRHYPAPEVENALPGKDGPTFSRALFSEPRGIFELPPLDLVEPPRAPFAVLLPPGLPGPAPRAYGDLLRAFPPSVELPDLFGGGDGADDAFDFDGGEGGAFGSSAASIGGLDAGPDSFDHETPAEREARLAAYRARYDWIRRGAGLFEFGRIENPDRFVLTIDTERDQEPILFVGLDPETGREIYGNVGAPVIPIPRSTVQEFGFAGTVANELELRLLGLGGELTRGTYPLALELADFALRHRYDAPRSLEIAESVYRRCAAYDPTDHHPRLGLARVLEADFRFEEAFAEYENIHSTFPSRAEPVVRLGLLEERLLLFASAEARLREAIGVDRRSWEARYGLGSFLLRRGRAAEAAEVLGAIGSNTMQPPSAADRMDVRLAEADARLALGQLEEAERLYGMALASDPGNGHALAGALQLETFAHGPWESSDSARRAGVTSARAASVGDGAEEGFALLMASGLNALWRAEWEEARDLLLLAVERDPLRANHPLAALSFLARTAGHDADALDFAERALECDPGDAYAAFLRGLLLSDLDDYEGALASFQDALEQEVDFEDALVWLGEMAFRLARFEAAERYLERALSLDDSRSDVQALRGINFLNLGNTFRAREAFQRAEALSFEHPTAIAGLAWCSYLDGDVTDALNRLANLDDARRNLPESDPWRLWAGQQIARISDHVEKVEWRDAFERHRLLNGWLTREGTGLNVSLIENEVRVRGTFDRNGTTQVYREYVASDFVSLTADVWISSPGSAKAGLFVARERQRSQSSEVVGEAAVLRHADGSLQVQVVHQGQPDESTDMQQNFPLDRWVRLSIQRAGESSETNMTLTLDGIPLLEGVRVPSLGSANSPLLVGLFVEGQTGRPVDVRMDNVSVVYRGNR